MLTLLTISLIILALASGPVVGNLLKGRNWKWVYALYLILFLLATGQAYYIFFSTGTFFVAAVTCLPLPAALIGVLYLFYWRGKNIEVYQANKSLRRMYWLGVLLVPLISLTPFFDLILLRSACFNLNQRAAGPILSAMENYHQDFGDYPEVITVLVPEYLDEIPAGRCKPLPGSSIDEPSFTITKCIQEEITILTIPIGSGEWIQRYNPESDKWAMLSFLDGACSFLDR